MKCIIAGCEIPPRHELQNRSLGLKFQVCGEHRKTLSELLNLEMLKVTEAHKLAIQGVINGIDKMGDHENELSLAI